MFNQQKNDILNLSNIRADFQLGDVITTLILLSKEPKGRYKLMEDLDLTESSVKSLLNYCKNINLVNASIGRAGHSLTNYGEELVNFIKKHVKEFSFFDYPIFKGKNNFLVLLKPISDPLQSWKVRDIALLFGGEAILMLNITKKGELQFPEEDIRLVHYFPELQSAIESTLNINIKEKMLLLIIGAEKKQVARKCAFMTAITIIPELKARFIH